MIHRSDFPYSVRIWFSFLNYESLHLPSACRFSSLESHGDNDSVDGHPTSCGSNIFCLIVLVSLASFSSTCPRLFYLSPVSLVTRPSLELSPVPSFDLFIVPLSSRNSLAGSISSSRFDLSGLDMNFSAGPRLTYGFTICNGDITSRT